MPPESDSDVEQGSRKTVDVAIVNWNTASSAIAAARAYAASPGVEARVAVADNDSEPAQKELLRDGADAFSLIENDANLGFGKAANLALAAGTAEFVLISNADVMPDPDAVGAMVEAFEATPDCGLVGPVFRGTDNYHDDLPGVSTLLVRIVVGGFNRKPIEAPAPGRVVEVEQPSGACFLTSRKLWERSGGFDERFFLWYEDVDLARRFHDMGLVGLVVGSALVEHQGAVSFAQLPDNRKQSIRLDSLGLYLRLHHRFAYLVSRPLDRLIRALRARGA